MNLVHRALIFVALAALLAGCGRDALQQQDAAVTTAWAEVATLYQQRIELAPQLAAAVEAQAVNEQAALRELADAQTDAVEFAAGIGTPSAFVQVEQTQDRLHAALAGVLRLAEDRHELAADPGFGQLQVQLEAVANRLAVARYRYNEQVQAYNAGLQGFPRNLTARLSGYKPRPAFSDTPVVLPGETPIVDFSAPASPARPDE